ncbi:MAG: GlcG/HbpS family heme-binding protein [Nostocoides sp.]
MHVRTTKTVTYAGARLAIDAAMAQADALGVVVNIAVTDNSGTLLAFARMDGAFAFSGPIAIDKAKTVCGFAGIPSDDLYGNIAGEPAVRDGIAPRAEVAAFAGGVPILIGEDLAGAVGVSGASAEEDKQVATAGAAALAGPPDPEIGFHVDGTGHDSQASP